MLSRYFRYLFEKLDDGMFHSGYIYDKTEEKTTNYVYMAGSYCRNIIPKRNQDAHIEMGAIPDVVDILVIGGYTPAYIKKLIVLVKEHDVKTIILPYLAPIQRLVLAEEIGDHGDNGRETIRFLQDPYLFLKEIGIDNIFFLYGNSSELGREPEELETGYHFEMADTDALKLIWEMEGYSIPVVKAGYIIENGWLFYFGVYGMDLQVLSSFTRDYFSHIENIHEMSANINEDYMDQMKKLVQKYLRKFGTSPATTIAMFEAPVNASPKDNDSFMSETEFDRKEHCGAGTHTCFIRCMHNKDYDTMQHHKNKDMDEPRFGMLILGNVSLNRYLTEIVTRFWKVRLRVRGISVPNCGNSEDWNHQILSIFSLKDRIYWICSQNERTSAGVVSDIVLSSPNNRFLTLNEEKGGCFSGYLVSKENIK